MNEKNESAAGKARNLGGKLAVGAGAALASGAAMAQESGFDASAITAKIDANVLVAVGIIGAFILGRWTLRSMGLLNGR